MQDSHEKGLYAILGSISVLLLLLVLLLVKRKAIKQRLRYTMQNTYFTIDELCKSSTASAKGIDNTPTVEATANLQALIDNILNPTRDKHGSYIKVNSGYRSSQLNAALGGSKTSQHLTGQAADVTGGSVSKNKEIFTIIAEEMPFDQLIWENGGQWVHVSYDNSRNRKQILSYQNGSYNNITNNWRNVVV